MPLDPDNTGAPGRPAETGPGPSEGPGPSGARRPAPGRPDRALVLGAGLSGLAAARLLAALGTPVVVADRQEPGALPEAASVLGDLGVALTTESRALAEAEGLLAGDALLVVSPGAPLGHPLIARARALGAEVVGELELGHRHADVPILAVTGTNGKTTVTALTGRMLEKAGRPVFVGGNIGNPLSALALDLLRGAPRPDYAVLEVSSFQLETVSTFRALAAAILNLTPDHLDRHGTMGGYLRVKARILEGVPPGGRLVLNLGDPLVAGLAAGDGVHGFALDPRRGPGPHGRGARLEGGDLVAVDRGRVLARAPWADFRLRGSHNQENVMAAVLLAGAAGVPLAEALAAAKDFGPGDHRLEPVGEFGGVRWIDDSKGTNVGAVAKALEAVPGPVILIMGGRDKGLDYGWLGEAVRAKVKRLIVMGECRELIRSALGGVAETTEAADLAEAVAAAGRHARPGDAVLLSPAAASFDQFRDYKERGEVFRREVLRRFGGACGPPGEGS